MLKILNLDPHRYSPKAMAKLSAIGEVEQLAGGIRLEDVIGEYHVLLLRFSYRIDRQLLNRAKQLRIIACNATGVDHIDEIAAAEHGIQIISLKGEYDFLDGIHATAELTWGLIMNMVRPIPQALAAVKKDQWQRDDFFANELHAKAIGIIGLGRIGKKIARYAHTFGMKIYAVDCVSFRQHASLNDIPINWVQSIPELFSQVDIASVHVPLNDSTRGLIDQKAFDAAKPGLYFVNTSRGQVVDECALLNALQTKQVKAAALDVLAGENTPGFPAKNALIQYANQHDNLLITPHIGGVTEESWQKTECFIADAIIDAACRLQLTPSNLLYSTQQVSL